MQAFTVTGLDRQNGSKPAFGFGQTTLLAKRHGVIECLIQIMDAVL
jgi:hypothetical protein